MKGIVFTEFLEMVEIHYGLAVVDTIIENADLPSQGVYTSVGTYDFNEMVSLLTNLSELQSISTEQLLRTFGNFLFDSLAKTHPEIIQSFSTPIGLLNSIEDHIHIHVLKLYPDAELPTFKILNKTATSISMIYSSSRALYALAHGLIEKTFKHFNTDATVSIDLLQPNGTEVKFEINQLV